MESGECVELDRLTVRAVVSFSRFAEFSWEALPLATDRRRVGEPVDVVADIVECRAVLLVEIRIPELAMAK